MSDRRSPQARANRLPAPQSRRSIDAAAWHASVGGHAQAVVIVAPAGTTRERARIEPQALRRLQCSISDA